MIIPDERTLKNLSESPYVCISKLFLQPKKTVLSRKMHVFKYISLLTKTTEDIYLLFRVFYKYELTSISYSMYIYICSMDTWTCFNLMSLIRLVQWCSTLSYKSIENKERLSVFFKKYSRLLRKTLTFILSLSSYFKH